MENPEEINRICTDHVSSLLLASTVSGLEEMKREGLYERTMLVGDLMLDAFQKYSQEIPAGAMVIPSLDGNVISIPEDFYYLTCHREENTNRDNLYEIFRAMESLDKKVVYPVHPRNQLSALRLQKEYRLQNLILVEPVGYLESIYLVNHSKKIITDSGGLQREAFFAQKPCVTVFDWVGWPETMVNRCNQLAKPDKVDILNKLGAQAWFDPAYQPFGDGHSAEKIVEQIRVYWNGR